MAKELAIREFKRNKDLKVVHVVLNHTFSEMGKAIRFQKSVFAKTVTSIFRTECWKELDETKPKAVKKNDENNNHESKKES